MEFGVGKEGLGQMRHAPQAPAATHVFGKGVGMGVRRDVCGCSPSPSPSHPLNPQPPPSSPPHGLGLAPVEHLTRHEVACHVRRVDQVHTAVEEGDARDRHVARRQPLRQMHVEGVGKVIGGPLPQFLPSVTS